MNGYYEPSATHRLERNLCIVAFVNAVSRNVGMTIASLIGVGVSVLDELVEHRLGASTGEILSSIGIDGFRAAEARELRRLLAQTPPGVIVLGEGALTEPSIRELARERAHLLRLDQRLDEVAEGLSGGAGTWAQTLRAELDAIPGCESERVEALYAIRSSEHRIAAFALEVQGPPYHRAALACIDLLESRGALIRS